MCHVLSLAELRAEFGPDSPDEPDHGNPTILELPNLDTVDRIDRDSGVNGCGVVARSLDRIIAYIRSTA